MGESLEAIVITTVITIWSSSKIFEGQRLGTRSDIWAGGLALLVESVSPTCEREL
jgi:hypothetical protein